MSFTKRVRRIAGGTFLGIGALGVSGAALLSATHPAAAASALAAIQSAVTCSVTGTNSCVSGTNTSSGIGVYGTSNSGTGVRGNANSNYGMKGTSKTSYGIYGSSTSGSAGVIGTTPNNYGVYGYTSGSGGGYGILGSSNSGYGVYGTTATGNGYGVVGVQSGSGVGLYGYSASSDGAEAYTANGNGIHADASGSGTAGYFQAGSGNGIVSENSGAPSVYARNANGNGADIGGTYIGVIGRAPASGGFPLVATDSNGNNLFYVDGAGNVSYKGSLSTFARTVGGGNSTAFSAKMTAPTVEDTGTAQLVAGTAAVRLNPAFAASVDPTTAYRVFITPNGDTHGLFVAQKTAAGFIVRESQSGHSTVSFDYRIVAVAVGEAKTYMAITGAGASLAGARATLPIAPKIARARPIIPAVLPKGE